MAIQTSSDVPLSEDISSDVPLSEDISSDVPSSEDEIDPQCAASKFVHQYYFMLEKYPAKMHKFYNDQSVVTRKGPNGEMLSVTTMEEINDEIMSSDYKGCSFDIINLDSQPSLMGGVLVSLMGNVIGMDNVRRRFNQTFFLAKQLPNRYVVLNDILRFLDPLEPEKLPTSTGTGGNADNVPSVNDQETPPTLQPKEVIKGEKLSGVEFDEKSSDVKNSDILSDTKRLLITIGETVLNIDSKEDASHIDNGKKTVSDSKDKLVENESKDKSTLTDVASNEHQDAKKISYASMVAKEAKFTSPTNISSYKIVRVAPNANQQLIATASATAPAPAPATATPSPRDPSTTSNNSKKEHIASNPAPDNNNGHADAPAPRSIYIANLPRNVTENGLLDALKIFGRIRPGGIRIRVFEDGFCYGFVDFESASSASKAVEVHNVTVGGNEAYMMYKRSGRSRNGYGGGFNGRSRSGNPKGQDNQESHGNSSQLDNDNQAVDIKSQPQESIGINEETNWQSYHRGGKMNSKNRQPSDERLRTGEALMKNGYPREQRRNGDAYPKKNSKQQ